MYADTSGGTAAFFFVAITAKYSRDAYTEQELSFSRYDYAYTVYAGFLIHPDLICWRCRVIVNPTIARREKASQTIRAAEACNPMQSVVALRLDKDHV